MGIVARDLVKRFPGGGGARAVDDVSFEIEAGELVALLGPSGGGKTTVLRILAGLESPDEGRVWLRGVDVTDVRVQDRNIGFVFQGYALFRHMTVHDNVALPLLLLHRADDARVTELLERVGLKGLGARMPAQLSGGQLQRVALARALVHRPALILADEPTGNLDPHNAQRTLDLLAEQVRAEGAACLLVTHSAAAARLADRVLQLRSDGLTEAEPRSR